jgi:hypothetical protein
MPGSQQTMENAKQRARQVLQRADAEMDALKSAHETVQRLQSSRTEALLMVETTGRARANLLKLAERAVRMEGAYRDHSAALTESSINSRNLAQLDQALTICYLLVALGKVADIYFVVYGKGKTVLAARARLIPNAKSAIVDIATTGQRVYEQGSNASNADMVKLAAQGANLALVGTSAYAQGDVITQFAETVGQAQTCLSTAIELFKDLGALLGSRNKANLKTQTSLYLAKLAETIAKLTDIVQRLTRMYEGFPSKVGDTRAPAAAQALRQDLGDLRKNWGQMKASEYLAVLKYAIEALQNFLMALSSGISSLDNRDLANQAAAEAERSELAPSGAGFVAFDLQQFADLSNQELLGHVRNINSAADAHQVASDSVIRAGRLRGELDRLNERLRALPAQKSAADAALDPALAQLRATDRELGLMLAEFERALGNENTAMRNDAVRGIAAGERRERDALSVAAWIGMIRDSRRKIHALTGDH